jgi:hypothetical protein
VKHTNDRDNSRQICTENLSYIVVVEGLSIDKITDFNVAIHHIFTENARQHSKPSIQFRIAYWSFKTFLSIFIPTARLRQPGKFSGGVSYSFVLLMQP